MMGATFGQMGTSLEKLDQLDAKLTEAINVMMTGMTSDLAKPIFNMKEKCIKEHGKNIEGRQLLWTIYEVFKVDPNS
eukprot:14615691-Heterocapsa_arctica.AAC.1